MVQATYQTTFSVWMGHPIPLYYNTMIGLGSTYKVEADTAPLQGSLLIFTVVLLLH